MIVMMGTLLKRVSEGSAARKERRSRKAKLRKRGAANTTEAIFAITIFAIASAGLLYLGLQEQRRVEDRGAAVALTTMADAGKEFIAGEFDAIRADLLAPLANGAAPGTTRLAKEIPIQELADKGYLSRAFLGDTGVNRNHYNQRYRIWVRAVLRSDTAWPPATLTKSVAAPLNTLDGQGVPRLINGVYNASDNEMDLEAILITEGGQRIPLDRGGRLIGYTQSPSAGMLYVQSDGSLTASGTRGNFTMPGAPWTQVGATLQEGRLLSLLWISESSLGTTGDGALRGALRRCHDITNEAEREACLDDGNRMWSDIVMRQRPALAASAQIAQAPGLYGIKGVGCREKASSSYITGSSATVGQNLLLIDCPQVNMSNNLRVEGEVRATRLNANNIDADRNITIATALNGSGGVTARTSINDKLVIASGTISNGQTSPAPASQCPLRPDGTPGQYKIDYWVSGLVETIGRPIAGYRTYQSLTGPVAGRDFVNTTTGTFRTSVMAFVSDDHCRNVRSGVIYPIENAVAGDFQLYGSPPNQSYVHRDCVPGSGNPAAGTPSGPFVRGDGFPDIYRLLPGQARISYTISCMP